MIFVRLSGRFAEIGDARSWCLPQESRGVRQGGVIGAAQKTDFSSLEGQNGGSGGFPGFQVAVRLLHVLQGIALNDVNPDLPAFDNREQVIHHCLHRLASGNVGE